MSSFENLRKETTFIAKELASLETPKFHGQKGEFPHWISKVEQVFTRHNLGEHEKFKVVSKKLRGYALEWWEKNKYKRKKRGKRKIKTWDKLRGKVEYAFAPTSYLHNHLFLSLDGNGLNSSSKYIPFNKGSPMSAYIPNSTPFLYLETPNPNKDEKIFGEEISSLLDPPPKFDELMVEELQVSDLELCGVDEIEELLYQEECPHSQQESPRSYELEIEELQVSDLEQCGDVDGIEELLCQEECPHLQQELRTILFEERGFDVYFQAHHFYSFNSISWEASSKQIYTWQGPSLFPLFEFHDERHLMEFYLNFKMPFFKRCSFGQQVQQLGDPNHLTSTLFTSILLLQDSSSES